MRSPIHSLMHRKSLLRYFKFLLGLTVSFLSAGTIALVWDGLHDDVAPADLGVVFGNTVLPDGLPSPRLATRLNRTLELFQHGAFPLILVSGARGEEGFDEAVVMRDYLIARGVPSAKIVVDRQGFTTFATATNTVSLLRERNLRSAMVVTQYFHISRAKLALRRAGVTTVYSAHADLFTLRDLYSIPRELVGYVSYLLKQPNQSPERAP